MGRRSVSNVPAQALILLNDPLIQQQAQRWAQRISGEGGSPSERVGRMYVDAFARPPRDPELRRCLDFLQRQAEALDRKPDDWAIWTDLAHALINTKEFLFLH